MVSEGRKKDLRFILQAAERLAVDDAVSVPLKIRAHGTRFLRPRAADRFPRLFGIRREEHLLLPVGFLLQYRRFVRLIFSQSFSPAIHIYKNIFDKKAENPFFRGKSDCHLPL